MRRQRADTTETVKACLMGIVLVPLVIRSRASWISVVGDAGGGSPTLGAHSTGRPGGGTFYAQCSFFWAVPSVARRNSRSGVGGCELRNVIACVR
jgi:hypothetical protein